MSIVIHCQDCDRQDYYDSVAQARRDWTVISEVLGNGVSGSSWIGCCAVCEQIRQKVAQQEKVAGEAATSQKSASKSRIEADIDRMAGGKKRRRKSWKGGRKKGK